VQRRESDSTISAAFPAVDGAVSAEENNGGRARNPAALACGVSVERSKGLPQIVLRDVTSEYDSGNTREMVVQTCPEPRVDNLPA
jgi:hypothetical protein